MARDIGSSPFMRAIIAGSSIIAIPVFGFPIVADIVITTIMEVSTAIDGLYGMVECVVTTCIVLLLEWVVA